MTRVLLVAACLLALPQNLAAAHFDHDHSAWTALLKRSVVLSSDGYASSVRYDAIRAEKAALARYLDALSAVNERQFQSFTQAQQRAFLINAYNAFTVELILTRYPRLESIKDLGSLIRSPWKRRFVRLRGELVSLDDIEHEWLRAPGLYDDPRVHFALNCASIGCPMLREEAYVADRLEAQLDDQMRRFLSDRGRNRWNEERQALQVSSIFRWYGEDFERGWRGIDSLAAFFAHHADLLADSPAARARIRERNVRIEFLDYDWRLNDAAH
jgi:hypothetical protein